jgi:prepilin-type N-terminal cleavage/methylation domain-containing protein
MRRAGFRYSVPGGRRGFGPSTIHHPLSTRHGFTLIELLVVIAIIAILAGLLLPVLAAAGARARQATCESNIKDIIRAVKIYYDDYGVYPDGLYGVSVNGGPLEKRLAGTKIQNEEEFTCPSAPSSSKRNNTIRIPVNPGNGNSQAMNQRGQTLGYPERSTYDLQYHSPNNPTGNEEMRYALKWTAAGVGGPADYPSQLYRKDAPADTVVTWCMYHADYNNAGNVTGGKAIVGFLGGSIRRVDARIMAQWGPAFPWQVKP